jgi:predicted nucleic-acid-binding Zn-ribbon protein
MSTHTQCPECGSSETYEHGDVSAQGGNGLDLLPGASRIFKTAQLRVVVCKSCGFARLYASQDGLTKVTTEHGWRRLR